MTKLGNSLGNNLLITIIETSQWYINLLTIYFKFKNLLHMLYTKVTLVTSKLWKGHSMLLHASFIIRPWPQLTFTCSKLTIETLEKDMKYLQS